MTAKGIKKEVPLTPTMPLWQAVGLTLVSGGILAVLAHVQMKRKKRGANNGNR